jgi:hypothetical protein
MEARRQSPSGLLLSGAMMLGAEAPAEVRGGRAGGSCQPDYYHHRSERFLGCGIPEHPFNLAGLTTLGR